MRNGSLIRLSLALGALAGWTSRSAVGQELALVSRSPRFLYAASISARPVEVDVGRTAVLQRVVALKVERPTVGRLLSSIERQTGLTFAYGSELSTARVVTLRADSITVASALAAILYDEGVDVVLSPGGHAALVERPIVKPAQQGSIVGLVTERRTDAPLPGATIEVQGTPLTAISGNDGHYRIEGVAAGAYTVRARYLGYIPSSASITVSADQEATADFTLEKSAQKLDEVVTTGTFIPTEVKALPTPVSVITSEDVELQHPRNIQQVLRQSVPTAVGWDMPGVPYQTAFSARGSTALTGGPGQMKVYFDGIEASSFSAAGVDPSSIDRIEVIRGPEASAIYGSDAIDGVIQVFTKRGEPGLTRTHLDAQAALGIQQTPYDGFGGVLRQSYAASIRGSAGDDASYNVGASYSHMGDYIPKGEISRQSTPSVYGGARFAHGIVAVDVSGRYYLQKGPTVENPDLFETGFVSVSQPSFQPSQFQSTTIGSKVTVSPVAWWSATVFGGVDRSNVEQTQVRPRLTTPADTFLQVFTEDLSKASIGVSSSMKGALGSGIEGTFTAGFDHYSLPVTATFAIGTATTGTLQNPSATRTLTNNTGYFAQGQLGIRDQLFLTAGLRAEENTNFGDSLGTPVSPRFGASYVHDVGDVTVKVRGSWGRAIRAPNPGDKLGQTSAFGLVLPNPTLGPERQFGWDAGLDAAFGSRGSIGVTVYNQIAKELIQSVTLSFSPVPTNQFQNVGRVKNSGIEVEGALTFGIVRFRAQYGYARAKIEDLGPKYVGDQQVGEQALVTPKHTAGASVSVTPIAGTLIAGGMTYVGHWNSYDYPFLYRCFAGTGPCPASFAMGSTRGFIVEYPGFVKLNLTVTQQLTPFVSGFVSMDNITNNEATEFINFLPSVGRVTSAGLQLHY